MARNLNHADTRSVCRANEDAYAREFELATQVLVHVSELTPLRFARHVIAALGVSLTAELVEGKIGENCRLLFDAAADETERRAICLLAAADRDRRACLKRYVHAAIERSAPGPRTRKPARRRGAAVGRTYRGPLDSGHVATLLEPRHTDGHVDGGRRFQAALNALAASLFASRGGQVA
jgi:hypothetical protein